MKNTETLGIASVQENRETFNDLRLNSSLVTGNVGINNDLQENTTKPRPIEEVLDLYYLFFT